MRYDGYIENYGKNLGVVSFDDDASSKMDCPEAYADHSCFCGGGGSVFFNDCGIGSVCANQYPLICVVIRSWQKTWCVVCGHAVSHTRARNHPAVWDSPGTASLPDDVP